MIGQRLLINKMMTRGQRDIFGIYTVVVDSYPPIFAQCHPEETILTLDMGYLKGTIFVFMKRYLSSAAAAASIAGFSSLKVGALNEAGERWITFKVGVDTQRQRARQQQ